MSDPGGGSGTGMGGLPDLEEPPAFIEGAGGGPAFPLGSLEDYEKGTYEDIANLFDIGTKALMSGGMVIGAGYGGGVAGCILWLDAGAMYTFGILLETLAADPPQPKYARPVEFKQRVSSPPQTTDPALEPLRVAIQQVMFACVTASGYLDAIERLQGAQQANDQTWALMQRGIADLAREQLIIDLANNGAALYAAGTALKGSQFDVQLDPGLSGAKLWIEDKENQTVFAPQLEASGFTREEMKRVIEYFKSDPIYDGSSSTLSAQIIEAGEKIHASAMKLFEMK
jgi:hypothetical protein